VNATWFIDPMALVSSAWSGPALGRGDPRSRLRGIREPEERQAVTTATVEEEVLAHAGRQLDGLDQRHTQHVAVELDGPGHVAAHQREVVDAPELERCCGHPALLPRLFVTPS